MDCSTNKPFSDLNQKFIYIKLDLSMSQKGLFFFGKDFMLYLITFTDTLIDIITKEYHHKLIEQTEKLKEKSITLNILDTIIHELTIQAIKLYIKELLTIMKIIKYDNNIDNVDNVIHSIRLIRRPFVFVKIP